MICPKCKAENRPEAAFCANCGNILLAQPSSAKTSQPEPVQPEAPASNAIVPEPLSSGLFLSELISHEPEPAPPEVSVISPVEPPVVLAGFAPLAEGTIFGERFRYDALVYQDGHKNIYTVTEIVRPHTPWVTICSNPACRTIHVPAGAEQEKFCTRCGHPMDQLSPLLLLQEADTDSFTNLQQIIDLQLAHPNIHPPVAIFQQDLPGGVRYCLVTPCSQDLPEDPVILKVLEWGLKLAEGLDYLHSHGVVLGEELNPSAFGIVDDTIVWRNFHNARVLPMLADREKINNVRLLALSLYSWITGNSTYSVDSSLNPSLNRLFHRALVGEGFTSGADLAQYIEQILKTGLSPLNLDYHVGKRTHLGKKREINEDSLLCLSLSRVQQGLSLPVGLFAVADGMGGHVRGELASSLSIQTILEKASTELTVFHNYSKEKYVSWLIETIQAANMAVYTARQQADTDMGSTLVCALLVGNTAYLAHLGDSRVYLLREKSIQQLSIDHSLVQQMVANGEISNDEARTHPQRNVILRCLGEKPHTEVEIYSQDLLPGDKLLLCSDGLTGMVEDKKIQVVTQEAISPQLACDFLVDTANMAGGEDNISVIIVEVILG
jgi:serine/threonine protein phosphatase PrpC